MEILLLNGAAAVGQGIIGSAIGDVYSSIRHSSHHSEFSKFIRDLGIKEDLEIVEALLRDVAKYESDLDVVDACGTQIREIVVAIQKEIDDVNLKFIEYQYSSPFASTYYRYVARYFWNIGGPDYSANVHKLLKLSARLRERRDILIKLITITRNRSDGTTRIPQKLSRDPKLEDSIVLVSNDAGQTPRDNVRKRKDASFDGSLYESALSG